MRPHRRLAQAAQSTADTAKNNATLAQQAADAAKDTADAAQEAADQAQAAADQAQAAVDALAVRVTEAETNILQNAEAVEINASKTEEIETNLANNYYNKTETDAKIKVESDRIAQTVTKVETDLNNLEIGGRNLLLNSSFNDDINKWETKGDLVTSLVRYKGKSCIKIDGNIGIYDYLRQSVLDKLSPDTEYTASAWVLTENIVEGSTDPSLWWCYHSGEYGDNAAPFSYGCADFPVNNQEWERVTWTFTTDDKTESATESYIYVYVGDVTGQVYISNLKLEKGNKATDWTPAPEDQATVDDIEGVQESITGIDERVTASASEIEQLANSISTLVTDENGQTLMEQTSTGWKFNIGSIMSAIEDAKSKIQSMSGAVDEADHLLSSLNELTNSIAQKTAYIVMATDDSGKPCIELGKGDDPFKVRITNTSMDFMEGSSKIAYISNKTLYIERVVVKKTWQMGDVEGFAFEIKPNGDMAVGWVGE